MKKQKKCPQCKNLISISAPTCLYCGRPNKFVTKEYIKQKWDNKTINESDNNINKYKYFLILLITSLLIIVLI